MSEAASLQHLAQPINTDSDADHRLDQADGSNMLTPVSVLAGILLSKVQLDRSDIPSQLIPTPFSPNYWGKSGSIADIRRE